MSVRRSLSDGGANRRDSYPPPIRVGNFSALVPLSGGVLKKVDPLLSLPRAVVRLALFCLLCSGEASGQGWIDLLAGDPVSETDLLSDLRTARITYLGEMHTARSHHRIEEQLLSALASGGAPLFLFLEMLEPKDEPFLSRFLEGELSFEEFSQRIDWASRWSNYRDYRGLLRIARAKRIPIFGLDGPVPLFRRIARRGWQSITPAERERAGLTRIRFDPLYQRLLLLLLPIHPGMTRSWLRRAAEAQEIRDDWMAQRIVSALRSSRGKDCHALVLCGAGHLRFGLGLPEHVAIRSPLPHRILLLVAPSQTPRIRAPSSIRNPQQPLPIPHAALEFIGRPLADYLWIPPKSLPARKSFRRDSESR
ncbi:hypothetical protein MAMC_00434 [Methylacidimicrobium cyclopophantes]|uniref:Haem-binding uptake Tiki superfamily ChaN domain-containing protein n=1 Tax=Methylacidimicrobium cyclopophantes TaxID=1041766 RepID=A0A5E6M9Y3_9BACT|nr:hypothetical protein MAMC_00434 [Methylacidimicrobium cyclopophantes]